MPSGVYNHYKQKGLHYNIDKNHPGFIKGITKKLLIKEYVKKRKTQKEVAKILYCSAGVIVRRLIKFNIPIRTNSEIRKGRKYPKHSKWMKERIVTKETRRKLSLTEGGTGIPYEFNKYPAEFFKIKPKILKRDSYICQKCGITKKEYLSIYGINLSIHHIDYNKQNCDENNLTTLCNECNLEVNKDRNYWYAYFTYKMEEYYVSN